MPASQSHAPRDRVTVVNLDRTPERLIQFARNNPGLPFDRFAAIDGGSRPRDAWIAAGLIATGNKYGPGAIGCAASHIALWRQCAAGSTPLHIAEDDAILRSDFLAVANQMLDGLGNWDIALWGHNFDWPVQVSNGPGLEPAILLQDVPSLRSSVLSGRFQRGGGIPQLLKLVSACGTCCYSVSPRGAQRALAACVPVGGTPAAYPRDPNQTLDNYGIDIELSRHYAHWDAYVALPPLAVTLNDHAVSTIQPAS